jgi:hypothetical protein
VNSAAAARNGPDIDLNHAAVWKRRLHAIVRVRIAGHPEAWHYDAAIGNLQVDIESTEQRVSSFSVVGIVDVDDLQAATGRIGGRS